MIFLFWFSLAATLYAYIGYPLLLFILSSLLRKSPKEEPPNQKTFLPTVTLIISAYNEEKVIEDKIRNSLNLLYPKELLEIIVASDGSTDDTVAIVNKYASQGVALRHFDGRIGKSACLNETIRLATGEIVVFSDANSHYDDNALQQLVERFSDEGIGFVTGHTRYLQSDQGKMVEAVGLYSRIELFVKQYEGYFSSCVGADGAIFAVRRVLFEPLHADDINDLVAPLNVVRKGYRGVLEPKAFCTESLVEEYRREFQRQVRIASRTIRAIVKNADLLNLFKFRMFAFQLLSHKVSKLLVPFFLACLFVSNGVLLTSHVVYQLVLTVQIGFYLVGLKASPSGSGTVIEKIVSFIKTFVIYNIAVLVGWFNYTMGKKYTTWTTVR